MAALLVERGHSSSPVAAVTDLCPEVRQEAEALLAVQFLGDPCPPDQPFPSHQVLQALVRHLAQVGGSRTA